MAKQEHRQRRIGTAMPLACCPDQGRVSEARDTLAPIYDWFTEGIDRHDLLDAKALLYKLS